MKLEEVIKESVKENYGGDSDKFLKNLELKTIMFLIFGGMGLVISSYIYTSIGTIPIFTTIISSIIFLFGVFSHRLYNKCFKILNKLDEN